MQQFGSRFHSAMDRESAGTYQAPVATYPWQDIVYGVVSRYRGMDWTRNFWIIEKFGDRKRLDGYL